MRSIFKIMFVVDMLFIASIRHVNHIPFLNFPLKQSFYAFENILTSSWLKVFMLLVIVVIIQGIAVYYLTRKSNNENDKQDREIKKGTFFENAEYKYIPSYLGINILAFGLSEQLQYLILLLVFCFFLVNTKLIFFSPWLKVFKNYRLYIRREGNKEELLIIKSDNNEDNYTIKKLAQIHTDVYIATKT